MKGSYILVQELSEARIISVGKLGNIKFKKGSYAYIGSALNGLEARISRHLRKNKKIFWHIDYLLKYTIVKDIYYRPGQKKEECTFAQLLTAEFDAIKYFGSSDCRCNSHLFFIKDNSTFRNIIQDNGMVKSKGLSFQ
ncbi:MAG: GIY-YIG nuclease family protein [Thermoplasmata archaeon]|nr:GIY-YIG nuclease family protein [Thermoplasmata archaeon]